jgi:hypothetical protein
MITREMFNLVNDCYNEVMDDLNDTFEQPEPIMPHSSEIIRDYKSIAAEEWEELTVEEADKIFDKIYRMIDESRLLNAIAWS